VVLGEAENWRDGSIVCLTIFCQEYFLTIFAYAVFFAAILRKIFACTFGQSFPFFRKSYNQLCPVSRATNQLGLRSQPTPVAQPVLAVLFQPAIPRINLKPAPPLYDALSKSSLVGQVKRAGTS
jgi:hypothetical protein